MSVKPKYWVGTPNESLRCDLCNGPFNGVFVDGALKGMGWANVCEKCHRVYGMGLGTGKGQKYEVQEDGKWLKTGG